jgi:hypothetical protein
MLTRAWIIILAYNYKGLMRCKSANICNEFEKLRIVKNCTAVLIGDDPNFF